jgi:hypothetical protein
MGVALRLAAALLGSTVVLACTVVCAGAAEHPNIVYILADATRFRQFLRQLQRQHRLFAQDQPGARARLASKRAADQGKKATAPR